LIAEKKRTPERLISLIRPKHVGENSWISNERKKKGKGSAFLDPRLAEKTGAAGVGRSKKREKERRRSFSVGKKK